MIVLKWFFRILPVAYMVAIWIMSSMPSNAVVELPDSTIDAFIKESLHLVEFAILYLLLVAAFLTTRTFTPFVSMICALFAAAYGGLDEIHQSFVPYRSATLIDLVKDWIGVSVSWYIIRLAYFEGRLGRLARCLRGFQHFFAGKPAKQ